MDSMQWATRCLAALAAAGLGGCAIVKSVPGVHGTEGTAYMLPRALLPVELSFDGIGFDLSVKPPITTGDPDQTYVLQRTGNIFTADTVTISVDRDTNLLTAVDVKSDDKTGQILTTLVTGLQGQKAEQGKTASGAQVVFNEVFDPGWPRSTMDRFNARLQDAAKAAVTTQAQESGCGESVAAAAAEACKGLARLGANLDVQALNVTTEGPEPRQAKPADCSAGFCYRINVPHLVRLEGPGVSRSQHVGLPNHSPTFVMMLERWAFVRTTHEVKLQAGMVTSVTTDRPSSALAVAALPFDIAKGAVSAASELIQLKVDLSGKEKALSDARIKEIEAKTKEKEAEAAALKPLVDKMAEEFGTASLGAPDLSVRIGPPARRDATQNLKHSDTNPKPASSTGGASAAPGQGSSGSLGAGTAR